MAVTLTNQTVGTTNRIVKDTSATNTAVLNVTGGPGTVYLLFINNAANSHGTYVKFYDTTDAVVVGTTVPDYIFLIAGSSIQQYAFTGGNKFLNGISYAAVREAGTAGTTAPGSAVLTWLIAS